MKRSEVTLRIRVAQSPVASAQRAPRRMAEAGTRRHPFARVPKLSAVPCASRPRRSGTKARARSAFPAPSELSGTSRAQHSCAADRATARRTWVRRGGAPTQESLPPTSRGQPRPARRGGAKGAGCLRTETAVEEGTGLHTSTREERSRPKAPAAQWLRFPRGAPLPRSPAPAHICTHI